jgi:hypothetical protein
MPDSTPRYAVHRTDADAARLLAGNDAAWSAAAAISWGAAPWTTRFRALWSPAALHLRFDAADERPWHTMTAKDEHIWNEEVVEIFLDPGGTGRGYAELEINHANVVCDLVVRTPWPTVDSDPAWDLYGLQTRVVPWTGEGAGPDGWSALAVIPWPAFDALPSKAASLPPAGGHEWRFNVYRIKRPHGPSAPERDVAYNAWSPTGSRSFHVPAAFGVFAFTDARG